MLPDTIINGWSHWHAGLRERPVILRSLQGGRSNLSYLLKSGDRHLVLRWNGKDTLLPGSNRHCEAEIWQAASAAGLAPPLLYTDEQQGILVSAYIQDNLPPRPEENKSIVEQALALLGRCHQLDVDAPGLDYSGHIRRYWQLLEVKDRPTDLPLQAQRKPMQDLLESLLSRGTPTALCHHDPIISNFVGGPGRLYLIDWEYAAQGLVVMDYAALAVEWGITDSMVVARSGVDPEALAMAKELYRHLCALWQAVTKQR